MKQPQRILLCRSDSIGDVMLTLPMAGVLKQFLPKSEIGFIGKTYTRPVVECSKHITDFINRDELLQLPEEKAVEALKAWKADAIVFVFPNYTVARWAKKAGIAMRVGVNRRLPHWWLCNYRVSFSRRKSDLHESQLNIKLLEPIIGKKQFTLSELDAFTGFEKLPDLPQKFEALLANNKTKVILHPKSQGSALEWGLERFTELIKTLPTDNYEIYISGTENEGKLFRDALPLHLSNVHDISGTMQLSEFIAFIYRCDALVAASTGPLHIASALGKKAIGLYVPKKPIHPGRWQPIGKNAEVLVNDWQCSKCAQKQDCNCIQAISAEKVCSLLDEIEFL